MTIPTSWVRRVIIIGYLYPGVFRWLDVVCRRLELTEFPAHFELWFRSNIVFVCAILLLDLHLEVDRRCIATFALHASLRCLLERGSQARLLHRRHRWLMMLPQRTGPACVICKCASVIRDMQRVDKGRYWLSTQSSEHLVLGRKS